MSNIKRETIKNITFSVLLFLTAMFFLQAENFSDKFKTIEDEFENLKAKTTTLNEFSPDNFPGFNELEKTNQLVELLDFNNRKFKLLLAQYNLITDRLFPLCKDYSSSATAQINIIKNKLEKFTGRGQNSLYGIQKGLNHVLLRISRIKKEIEMVQLNKRNREMSKAGDEDYSRVSGKLPLKEQINLLTTEENETGKELAVQLTRMEELKKEETKRSNKIDEKSEETKKLKNEARTNNNVIERLISRTLAEATGLRMNGLEIPLLNTTRTMIYLTDTKISTLKDKIANLKKNIFILKEKKSKEFKAKLLKGVLVIMIAVFLVIFLLRIARIISRKTLKRVEKSEMIDTHKKQRYQTLSSVILSFVKIVLWTSAVIWVLGVLNIDYGPFLLAAGGISLAIGFGAQSLVKDIVTGFFLLMEEQFALGDVVEINGKSGTIEKISLRTVKFRSLDGTLHIIPNGEVSHVANSTYQWSRAIINIGVSYDVDSSKVMNVLQSVCSSMYQDDDWKGKIIEKPVPQGILSFGDSSVNYRILAKTSTGEQWGVTREFNIRLQKAFNENNIDIPYNYINIVNVTK